MKGGPAAPPGPRSLPAPARASREALWRDAGLVRTREGLERLRDDPYPLVALIAAHALLREETRGAHIRADFPRTDAALDGHHTVSRPTAAPPAFERWT
jgi:L-aspartate oxidase